MKINTHIYPYLFLFLISLILMSCKQSTETQLSESFTQKLYTELENQQKRLNFPGVVVGLWIDEKGVWESKLGVANKHTHEKIRFDAHFRIGSITKTFVTTAILILADQKKLSLDDVINTYVEGVPNGDKITIRQLGNMTAGLANYSESENFEQTILINPDKSWTTAELLELSFEQENVFEPGTHWQYSNTNTALLGMVIEKITNQKLPQALETLIFKPLKLKHTIYPMNNQMPSPYARGYTLESLDGSEQDATFRNPTWTNAAGQMISTLGDLKIWAHALGTGKLLSPDMFKERTQWVEMSSNPETKEAAYGFGIFKINDWIGHNGKLPGYNSFVLYNPKLKATFVCLVNSDSALVQSKANEYPADMLAKHLTQIISNELQPTQ